MCHLLLLAFFHDGDPAPDASGPGSVGSASLRLQLRNKGSPGEESVPAVLLPNSIPPLTEEEYQAQHQGLPYHHVMQVIDTNTLP